MVLKLCQLMLMRLIAFPNSFKTIHFWSIESMKFTVILQNLAENVRNWPLENAFTQKRLCFNTKEIWTKQRDRYWNWCAMAAALTVPWKGDWQITWFYQQHSHKHWNQNQNKNLFFLPSSFSWVVSLIANVG